MNISYRSQFRDESTEVEWKQIQNFSPPSFVLSDIFQIQHVSRAIHQYFKHVLYVPWFLEQILSYMDDGNEQRFFGCIVFVSSVLPFSPQFPFIAIFLNDNLTIHCLENALPAVQLATNALQIQATFNVLLHFVKKQMRILLSWLLTLYLQCKSDENKTFSTGTMSAVASSKWNQLKMQ